MTNGLLAGNSPDCGVFFLLNSEFAESRELRAGLRWPMVWAPNTQDGIGPADFDRGWQCYVCSNIETHFLDNGLLIDVL